MEAKGLNLAKWENHTIDVIHSEGLDGVPFLHLSGTKTIVE
jgi:hypothetical protein